MASVNDILEILEVATPPAKRAGVDLTLEDLFDVVASSLNAHESQSQIHRSTFYRSLGKLKVTPEDNGYYTKRDAAVITGWFLSKSRCKTYAKYRATIGKRIYSKFSVA